MYTSVSKLAKWYAVSLLISGACFSLFPSIPLFKVNSLVCGHIVLQCSKQFCTCPQWWIGNVSLKICCCYGANDNFFSTPYPSYCQLLKWMKILLLLIQCQLQPRVSPDPFPQGLSLTSLVDTARGYITEINEGPIWSVVRPFRLAQGG